MKLKTGIYVCLGFILIIGSLFLFFKINGKNKIVIPKPFTIAIDDLGWMQGSSMEKYGGPFRAGLRRSFEPFDYNAIIQVAKELDTRLQCYFILAEMDRENLCANVPTSTQQGINWDNSQNFSETQLEIMSLVQNNSAYMEFGMHGVGHEHWENGEKTRAEWYDIENNKPWDEKVIRNHVALFRDIMAQYGLSAENGHSFPESFTPCAFSYYWNPHGDYSMGKILGEFGVKYANTNFTWIRELNPPYNERGGFDHGVLVLHRENSGISYYSLASLPSKKYDAYKSGLIGSHFPNWLAQDYFLQESVNKKWIQYFKTVQRSRDSYYPKNTEQFYSQWLYKKYTHIKRLNKNTILIDNSLMIDEAYHNNILNTLVLKIKLKKNQHVSDAFVNDNCISSYFEDEGYGFLELPKLEKTTCKLTYKLDTSEMNTYVRHTGTYNIYSFTPSENEIVIEVKLYGTQDLVVKSNFSTANVSCDNPNIVVNSVHNKNSFNIINLTANNIQGETGNITIIRGLAQ